MLCDPSTIPLLGGGGELMSVVLVETGLMRTEKKNQPPKNDNDGKNRMIIEFILGGQNASFFLSLSINATRSRSPPPPPPICTTT